MLAPTSTLASLHQRFAKRACERTTMKKIIRFNSWGKLMSVSASIMVLTIGAMAAQETEGEGPSFTEKMKEWQEKMSDGFRDVLKLEVQGDDTREQERDGSFFSKKAQYSQVLSLPGPVQADKMTVDRKENMLIVTLPKASAG
jgi:hypothetical protein